MTDDDRLAELFRAAASAEGAPAPGFGHGEVVAASRRITVRRRAAVLAGAFVLFAALGVGVAVARPGEPDATTVAAPAAAPEAASPAPADSAAGAIQQPDAARGVAPFTGAPLGPGTGECADRQDPALRAYVEQVLPEVAGATPALTTQECLPGAERYLDLEVVDAGTPGLFGVSYLPPGTIAELVPGAVSAPTASGGTVIVHSSAAAAGAPPPFAGRLGTVAAFLAPRL